THAGRRRGKVEAPAPVAAPPREAAVQRPSRRDARGDAQGPDPASPRTGAERNRRAHGHGRAPDPCRLRTHGVWDDAGPVARCDGELGEAEPSPLRNHDQVVRTGSAYLRGVQRVPPGRDEAPAQRLTLFRVTKAARGALTSIRASSDK